MNNEELKARIGSNIVRLRKARGMTQAELAEKLNYSDKAISKWERGESLPDVLTLIAMAKVFGTNVNAIVSQEEEPALQEPVSQPQPEPQEVPAKKRRMPALPLMPDVDKGVIQKLSSALVWVIALFLYLVLDSFALKYSWMVFVLAVLANAIVLLCLRAAWKMYGINRILVSIIMWTALLFVYLTLLLATGVHVWRILPMGLLGQVAIVLWFKIFKHPGEEEKTDE